MTNMQSRKYATIAKDFGIQQNVSPVSNVFNPTPTTLQCVQSCIASHCHHFKPHSLKTHKSHHYCSSEKCRLIRDKQLADDLQH